MIDSLGYLLWGIAFGLAISAPIGPVNIIALQRALTHSAYQGFLIGLGAAIADTLYAALAAFGLGAVYGWFMNYEIGVKMTGGMVMLLFAIHVWRAKPTLNTVKTQSGLKRAVMAAFIMTITNPGVFVGFLGLFTLAGLGDFGAGDARHYNNGLILCLGVLLGSMAWWLVIAVGGGLVRSRITEKLLLAINRFFAFLIGGFALFVGVSALI